MEYSDDKLNYGGPDGPTDIIVNNDSDYVTMPKITATRRDDVKTSDNKNDENNDSPSVVGELIAVAVKATAIALSLLAMLVCILAVGLPFTSMRLFNKFGMSERAVDFGERYISGELNEYGAAKTDNLGNYFELSRTAALTNDDFTEALYVCNSLSRKLMNGYFQAGDTARGRYYAERLEKYTRMYLSLNNVALVNSRKDARNIASVPVALRPTVYSYAHEMRVMNYRARSYLGTTDRMLYEPGLSGIITETQTQSATFAGSTQSINAQLLDEFVDYVDQLGEYLDVEFLRAGVENDLSKKFDIRVGDRVIKDVPVYSETYMINKGRNVLKGTEFSVFLNGTDAVSGAQAGFTSLYTQLKCFGAYAQWAVDYVPSSGANAESDRLKQLYWLQILTQTAQRFWYMENLLYYSRDNFGISSNAIADEYVNSTCQKFGQVTYDSRLYRISEVYTVKLGEYLALFSA